MAALDYGKNRFTVTQFGTASTNHAPVTTNGLTGSANLAIAPAPPFDPFFSSTVLLLGFEGVDGATTTVDASPSPKTLTFNGNAQIDTAQFKFGVSSLLLDGTGDYLTAPDSADWAFGAGDFTAEGFFRFNNNTADQVLFGQYAASGTGRSWRLLYFGTNTPDILRFEYSTNGSAGVAGVITSAWTPTIGQWYHIVVERSETTWRIYVDGVMLGRLSLSVTLFDTTSVLRIGDGSTSGVEDRFFNGWIDELRITKGVARYNTDVTFPVPTAAFPRIGPPIIKDLIITYSIEDMITQSLVLDYAIQLTKDLIILYGIPSDTDYFFNYMLVYGVTAPAAANNVDDEVASASVIGANVNLNPGMPAPPDHYVGATIETVPVLYFYGDYYLRIWQDPTILRLSNPRYDVPIGFNVWSAYPVQNNLVETIATDLPGVVLGYTAPVLFEAYEFKRLTFSISVDAPATLDGSFDFVFDMGSSHLDVIATIVAVMEARPDEPITEQWSWNTVLNIAKGSPESRARMRNEPRYQISFDTTLVDDAERRTRYNQVWTFISRDLQIPLYQYRTSLTASSLAGSNKIFFDPLLTDIRSDEYFVLFNTIDRDIVLAKGTIDLDGATLEGSLAADVDETWWVIPTISMRMSDGTGLSMDAVTGSAGITVASTKIRALLPVANSPSLLTWFDDMPVLLDRMIAQTSLDDSFDQDIESIDGGSYNVELYTQWPQPFVSGSREWKFDREDPDQINYWREFGDYVKGSQKPFLVPTWREDLTLFEAPVLGSSTIKVEQAGFVAQYVNGAYSRLQLLSANGVAYKGVTSVEDLGDYILVTLDSSLGSTPGDEEISMISFLNRCRIADDIIKLTHYVNWTIATLKIRTIDV